MSGNCFPRRGDNEDWTELFCRVVGGGEANFSDDGRKPFGNEDADSDER